MKHIVFRTSLQCIVFRMDILQDGLCVVYITSLSIVTGRKEGDLSIFQVPQYVQICSVCVCMYM